MVSTSKAKIVSQEDGVNQGDVFKDVKYSFIDSEDNESIDVIEYIFPYAVVVSQSCDVAFMDEFESGGNSLPVKYMPSILLCPIYSKELIAHGDHLKEIYEDINRTLSFGSAYYNKDDMRTTEKDQHVRFHALKVDVNNETLLDNMVIDFKHIFSVPMKYLRNNRDKRICSIEDIYIDQIVNKMAAYISRIGLPDPKIIKNYEK